MKLKSGREVKVEPLTVRQRAKIDDRVTQYYFDLNIDYSDENQVARAPFSYDIALDAIEMISEIPEDITNLEIMEWFNLIYEKSHTSDLQKKS